MLPKKILARKTGWVWIAALVLSPLAYAAGLYLIARNDHNARVGVTFGRGQAVEMAARFASAKGVNTEGWDDFCAAVPDNNLHFYYRLKPGAERDRIRSWARELEVKVLLRGPDRREKVEVTLAPDGRIRSYKFDVAAKQTAPDPGEAAARRVAEAALRARPEAAEFSAGQPQLDESSEQSSGQNVVTRTYTWHAVPAALPELKLRFVVAVRGDAVIREALETELDAAFDAAHWAATSAKIVGRILYALLLTVGVFFGFYRFIRRARQKEVSYWRTGLPAAVIGVLFSLIPIVTGQIYQMVALGLPELAIYAIMSLVWFPAGLFMGLAYGAGESDVREAFPGKLTALDALLTGKIFSRNVARAVVVGTALGGWMLLSAQIGLLLFRGAPSAGEGLSKTMMFFVSVPWLTPVIVWPLDTVLVLVFGLLLPPPWLHRRVQNPRWRLCLIALCIFIACQAPYLDFHPWAGVWLMAAVRTFFMLLVFFNFGVLTAAFTLAAPPFFGLLTTLAAQPAAELHRIAYGSFAFALVVLLVETYFAFKGRVYVEEEVRPVYASMLAERLSMQAEVSAAREAQMRLLPQSLPVAPQFTVAAACVPAQEVGGDFFDFFELEPGRLGVLVAEGGGRGLEAALSIAFAKGFLTPKIMGRTRADDAPPEILRALQDKLAGMLDDAAGIGFLYAVIDTTNGTLRYARTGDYPRVLVGGDELSAVDERELKFTSPRTPETPLRVWEGRCALAAGTGVAIFTGGLAEVWRAAQQAPQTALRQLLAPHLAATEGLQQALLHHISDHLKHARRRGPADDLTAVIVRVERSAGEG